MHLLKQVLDNLAQPNRSTATNFLHPAFPGCLLSLNSAVPVAKFVQRDQHKRHTLAQPTYRKGLAIGRVLLQEPPHLFLWNIL